MRQPLEGEGRGEGEITAIQLIPTDLAQLS